MILFRQSIHDIGLEMRIEKQDYGNGYTEGDFYACVSERINQVIDELTNNSAPSVLCRHPAFKNILGGHPERAK